MVLLGFGVIALFIGVALAAPRLVKPLARLVGWPGRRTGGVAGELASANAVRNPSRTASTAAALMIGLTLVTVVAVLGAGLRSSVEGAVTDQVEAPYILDSGDNLSFGAAEGDEIAKVDGVKSVSHVRTDTALVAGRGVRRHRHRPGDDRPVLQVRLGARATTRTVPKLGVDDAVIAKSYADDNESAVGGKLKIQSASGDERTVVVRGIYDPPEIDQMLGMVSITQQAFDETFPQPKNRFTFIDADRAPRPRSRRPRHRSTTPSSTRARRSRRTTRRASRAS